MKYNIQSKVIDFYKSTINNKDESFIYINTIMINQKKL